MIEVLDTDITTLELMVRPFAALGELGGGFLLSGAIGHRFGHLHLWALLDPFAAAAVEKLARMSDSA